MMDPIARDAYDELAERFASVADDKLENAYLDRPATLSLLPEVRGKAVLDAGCGAGAYSEALLGMGASTVVAFDVSPRMVECARNRLGSRAQVRLADFEEPLGFVGSQSQDLVVCGLALSYARDLGRVYAEFSRVLRPGGFLVASLGHPWAEMRWSRNESYLETEMLCLEWRGFGEPNTAVRWFRRPLAAVLSPLFEQGFLMDRLIEPIPLPEGREKDPETYDRLCRMPGFLCFRAVKPDSSAGR
ncbi:class I SAM-dependent methyltransferase [Candidatus Fermentibacterales bacterium]|nr:class I SAM-dependent methyltransferase [Candidatus Fermentibacterales bacterium]